MKKLSLYLIALFILNIISIFSYGNNTIFLTTGSKKFAAQTTICNNPAVPHPASVAGFTTLAYCADFTTNTGINNVYNAVSQNQNWVSMGWLDCAANGLHNGNVAGAQWVRWNGFADPNPCVETIGTDPAVNKQALIFPMTPATGNTTIGISSGAGGCNVTANVCYESFPLTNMFVEVSLRYVPSTVQSFRANNANEIYNMFSFLNGGNVSFNFIENFGTQYQFVVGGGDNTWCGGCTQNNGNNSPFAGSVCGVSGGQGYCLSPNTTSFDANYHTISNLLSANSSIAYNCTYVDGVSANWSNNCNSVTQSGPGGSNGNLLDMGYYIMQGNNTGSCSGQVGCTGVTGNITNYVAWIRIWVNGTCASDTRGRTGLSNTCSTASPFTTNP